MNYISLQLSTSTLVDCPYGLSIQIKKGLWKKSAGKSAKYLTILSNLPTTLTSSILIKTTIETIAN